MRRLWATIGIASAVLASAACAAPGATASAATTVPAYPPSWHDILTVPNGTPSNTFETVVATGKTTGWAFPSNGEYAYQRTGATTWKKVQFPGKGGGVAVAAATSPTNVWAGYVGLHGTQVDRFNGKKWAAIRSFPGWVNGLSVLASDDVWVFGGLSRAPGQGVFHYNGHTWTQVAKTLSGGSVLSDKDVWAYKGQTVARFNGTKWTATNVAKLLPAPGTMGHFPGKPYLTSVIALSASDVYAIGAGIDLPLGGPVVVLHYNGHTWSKAAEGDFISPNRQQLIPDGKGGLWIPAAGPDGNPALLHYFAGKLTRVTLPGTPPEFTMVDSVSRIPGTTAVLAGGFQSTAGGETSTSVILQYG